MDFVIKTAEKTLVNLCFQLAAGKDFPREQNCKRQQEPDITTQAYYSGRSRGREVMNLRSGTELSGIVLA